MMGECIKFGRGKIELYKPKFADNSWSNIITACQTDAVPETWKVGDQKAMTIGGTDYLIDIIGKNHDTYSDGTGKAPLTFQMHNLYETAYTMNASSTNSGGWSNTVMRKTTLPAILKLMPPEVQVGIREVSKLTKTGGNASTILTSSDKLFLLSEIETFTTRTHSGSGEGTQYAYYAAGNSAKKTKVGSNSGTRYWLRSPLVNNSTSFCIAMSDGTTKGNTIADGERNIAFAFCF